MKNTKPNLITRYGSLFMLGALLLFMGSCNLLEVENPNSLTVDDVSLPSSAEGLKNGQLNALMSGMGWTFAATTTISDEIYWTGSYESYKTYSEGLVGFDANEILVAGYPEISQARYMSDFAIEKLEEFDANDELSDRSILVKSYIYGALTRIVIADSYDNFVFSNGTETSPAIGEDQMSSVYDQAISFLDSALPIAQSLNNNELQAQVLGLRARAKHAKGVWNKLNPKGSIPANPLVSGTGAISDAEDALALMSQDYKAIIDYNAANITNYMAGQVNSRGEITLTAPFNDIITGDTDPRAEAIINDFNDTQTYTENYSPFTWLSAREMHLIIAEELVGTDDITARNEINAVRSLDGLPDMQPGDDFVEFIEHERRANLLLQGRRLNDMYRFGSTSPDWLQNEDAITTPGTLLPIPRNEQLANPDL
ncbi:RagB/SusD family nutrient uptake outer membrane protein [Gracilimonas amylolytica]|uniref:RagB/SusD family nutrient uptake outer membrane protein n=1 Tax=Gracilimonas amylolytica TaxID=1749045 RepID=UPI0012FFE636|nr:RagB/SusD family nutrient uptake outer membrane protein [Gracilimonas amylolytica]